MLGRHLRATAAHQSLPSVVNQRTPAPSPAGVSENRKSTHSFPPPASGRNSLCPQLLVGEVWGGCAGGANHRASPCTPSSEPQHTGLLSPSGPPVLASLRCLRSVFQSGTLSITVLPATLTRPHPITYVVGECKGGLSVPLKLPLISSQGFPKAC